MTITRTMTLVRLTALCLTIGAAPALARQPSQPQGAGDTVRHSTSGVPAVRSAFQTAALGFTNREDPALSPHMPWQSSPLQMPNDFNWLHGGGG